MAKLGSVNVSDARRLLMHGAGLLGDPARSVKALAIVRQLGFLQLDSINVVERAHELILHARSDSYRVGEVFRELDRGKVFEHWTHDASLIPVESYRHWHHRFERSKSRGWHLSRLGSGADQVIAQVLERVRQEGRLRSRDFEAEGHKSAGWWNWKPAKAALEYLWRTGQLAVAGRENFQKVYDLPERALRNGECVVSDYGEMVEWACSTALERLGIATPAELAAFYAAVEIGDARGWVHAGLKSGRLAPVEVEGRTSVAFHDVRRRVSRLGEAPERVRLLAPFDPLVRDRARALRLFGFHYRFEAFVPAAKRVHGYYVLPVLAGDRLVGRVDAKIHRVRGGGELMIGPAVWEAGAEPRRLRGGLRDAAERLGRFAGATSVTIRH